MKIRTEGCIKIANFKYQGYFFFSVDGFTAEDYKKAGYQCVSSKSFFDGYQKYKNPFGKVFYTLSEKEIKISKIKETYSHVRTYNTAFDIVHQFKMENQNLKVSDLVTFGNKINKIYDQAHELKFQAEKYGMSYYECLYEKTQRVVKITLTKFNFKSYEITEKKVFEDCDEICLIQGFIDYFDNINVDCLVCFTYELALAYIYERWSYLSQKEEEFQLKIYKTITPSQIHVGNLNYDAPDQYVYLSVFYIYFSLNKYKAKGGFTPKTISEYFYKEDLSGNIFNIQFFKDQNYLLWTINSNEMFKTDYRNMLGPPSVKFYNYLVGRLGETYLFEYKYSNFSRKIGGGKVLNYLRDWKTFILPILKHSIPA